MIDFTTVIAVSEKYLPFLAGCWQTWLKNRAGLFKRPLVIMRDHGVTQAQLDDFKHPDRSLVTIPHGAAGVSMREKVLTAFVKVAPSCVETPWWLKLDVDTVAERYCGDEWAHESIVSLPGDIRPVLVASGWNYTKPADAVQKLDKWAEAFKFPEPPLNLPFDPAAGRVITRGRIASYVCFHDTEWSLQAADLCAGRPLPVPSHDTYLWYVARRQGKAYRCFKMKRFGWSFTNHRRIDAAVKKILESK